MSYMLPGQVSSGNPRKRVSPILFLTVFTAIVGAGGFLVWQKLSTSIAASVQQRVPSASQQSISRPAPALNQAEIDDLTLHLQNAARNTIAISEAIKKAQNRTKEVMPVLTRNYFELDQRRLQSAYAYNEEALRQAARIQEELDVALGTLNQQLKGDR